MAKKKQAASKRSSDDCGCGQMNKVPMTRVHGFTGFYCSNCLHVFSYEHATNSQIEEFIQKVGGVPIQEAEVTVIPPAPAPVEARKEESKPEPVLTNEITGGEQDVECKVTNVYPVSGKPADMVFYSILPNGKAFSVIVPSTIEKVRKAIAEPSRIVGKTATISIKGFDQRGFPVSPRVLKLV